MTSSIAWLDASVEDQRRMREIVQLFSTTDSRDELGIGQIRDAISDTLFPGTSTLLTRARYFLFVPWCFLGANPGSAKASARAEQNERDLIETMRRAGATDGLLGAQAGRRLKTLPSAIYWNSMRRWAVLAEDAERQDAVTSSRALLEDGTSTSTVWHATIPPPPPGFPGKVDGGFALASREAAWLRDRILASSSGTLLAHLAELPPDAASTAPWLDGSALVAAPDIRAFIEHARLFSLVVHGAALLYNLLLGEAWADAGFQQADAPDRVARYRERLYEWHRERDASLEALTAWSFVDFRARVSMINQAVSPRTWHFVDTWRHLLLRPDLRLADDEDARRFVAGREREHKRGQARLRNRQLLGSWGGDAGSGRLVFRWGTVQRLLGDIHEGLGAAGA